MYTPYGGGGLRRYQHWNHKGLLDSVNFLLLSEIVREEEVILVFCKFIAQVLELWRVDLDEDVLLRNTP